MLAKSLFYFEKLVFVISKNDRNILKALKTQWAVAATVTERNPDAAAVRSWKQNVLQLPRQPLPHTSLQLRKQKGDSWNEVLFSLQTL